MLPTDRSIMTFCVTFCRFSRFCFHSLSYVLLCDISAVTLSYVYIVVVERQQREWQSCAAKSICSVPHKGSEMMPTSPFDVRVLHEPGHAVREHKRAKTTPWASSVLVVSDPVVWCCLIFKNRTYVQGRRLVVRWIPRNV